MSQIYQPIFQYNQAFLDQDTNTETKTRPLSEIHIRLRQRNGRKTITTVEGLSSDLDLKKIVKYMRKSFFTSGAILKGDEEEEVLQFAGDQRENCREFLCKYKIWEENVDPPIRVHGF